MRRLSHSQMETWEQCPRKWRLQKVDRVPQSPSEHLIFGDAIHAIIQADGERLMAGKSALPELGLVARFHVALEKRWHQDDPDGLLSDRMPTLRLRGLATIHAYVERVQPHFHPVAVESSFTLPVPELDGWEFTGRIDAVTERNGVSTVVDFKTATKPWSAGAEHGKDQAAAYLWAGDGASSRVTFIVFPTVPSGAEGYTCPVEYRPTFRSAERIAAYVDHVRTVAGQIEAAQTRNSFPVKLSPLCAWCPCLGSCPDGMAHLQLTNRKPAVPVVAAKVPA